MAEIIRRHGNEFRQSRGGVLRTEQERALRDLAACRTAVLGGRLYRCNGCGHEAPLYNSCGNRHCPQCHAAARARWFAARQQELLPAPYFHAVFTLPHELADVARSNRRVVYGLLFRAAAETLLELAADPRHLGARIGMLAVLHTWGQRLELHPHVHLIVTGGGLSPDGDRWMACPHENFLLPLAVVSAKYRGKFLDLLRRAWRAGRLKLPATLGGRRQWQDLVSRLYAKKWVVYLKPPFGGPRQVLKYLARYTHRVAISNRRLIGLRDGRVRFSYKDYRRGGQWDELELPAVEFLRRFLQHVLPKGLVRIRSYGIWSNRHRGKLLPRCRTLLGGDAGLTVRPESAEVDEAAARCESEAEPPRCPHCGQGILQHVASRPRPAFWMLMAMPFPFDTS